MAENQSQQGSECDGNCNSCPSAQKDENGQATCGLPPKVQMNVKHVILVLSGKGGVGKTTVSVNLAFALANRGKDVGLLDLDIHGPNVPKMVGVEGERLMVAGNKIEPVHATGNLSVVSMEFLLPDGETPVIWRGPMKMTAIKQFLEDVNWGDLDYLVVDLPPGTGDEALSIIQLAPQIEGAVIVTTPQAVSTMDSSKAVRFVEKLDLKVLGIVENMSGLICPDCGKEIDIFGKGGGKTAAEKLGVPYLGAIPIDPAMREAGDEGRPFINMHNDSPSWKAIDAVMENLVKNVEE
ncbi:Mrp family chromosome partitioning ATPase [Methanofollis sp. W23]|uniref:Mrp/NBP35 family ATP-binding protein n=1 Tax=Methanofollis sp. W23 TaxID=2817849 RepID=UPI001AE669FB|nr:Mrp/NBP35 family ATP-binding protein [Methanofollis sp. W23]MBP2146155.1 Mrp family chromosome partitioning ATPase [Methanofollis sp. W23]